MAEEKKRFPYWLLACSAILVIVAAVFGFIETVGRQGTIVGRYERIKRGMSFDEATRILGEPDDYLASVPSECNWELENDPFDGSISVTFLCHWSEGPAGVWVEFGGGHRVRNGFTWECPVFRKALQVDSSRFSWWHVRRWGEKAWTAIRGPRR